ncbi:MAG TPA: SDR family oxidoreductase [Caulobacteraceae bacterium]|jgi:NAD(P)-dependent dehydrogenase (short-subunit alcohol dehydrogenase family)|nr:SDR family oxidoreductase [Caulobacteraceae bacterium]
MALNVLITGANSGFGLLTAATFAQAGHIVHAGYRDPLKIAALEALTTAGLEVRPVRLDVTDEASVRSAAGEAAKAGLIDVLVNNAGFEVSGPVEHLSDASLHRQFDTNVLGVVRMVRAVAPAMRERGEGLIVNVSSVAGHIAAPFTGAYSASKHAVEALSEALWFEMRPFGVRVVLIEPGAFSTNFGDNVIVEPAYGEDSPYRPIAARFNTAMAGFRSGPPQDPQEVANLILAAAADPDPKLRILAGDDARMLVPLYRSMDFEAFAGVMLQRLGLDDLIKAPRPG